MAPSPLLLLFFLVTPAFSATLFVISGIITCNSPFPFQYRMRVIEEDVIVDDILFTDSVRSAAASPVPYNITTSDTTDMGTFSYELFFHVLHNCNSKVYTKNAKAVYNIGSYKKNHKTHYISYNIDLTDKGSPYKYDLEDW